MYTIKNLDTRAELGFTARTAYEAMQKLVYTLNLKKHDNTTTINKTESGLHLWLGHNGETWAIRNN